MPPCNGHLATATDTVQDVHMKLCRTAAFNNARLHTKTLSKLHLNIWSLKRSTGANTLTGKAKVDGVHTSHGHLYMHLFRSLGYNGWDTLELSIHKSKIIVQYNFKIMNIVQRKVTLHLACDLSSKGIKVVPRLGP